MECISFSAGVEVVVIYTYHKVQTSNIWFNEMVNSISLFYLSNTFNEFCIEFAY